MKALKNTRVKNMMNHAGTREVPNQFIIYTPEGRFFQSYDSIIAHKTNDGKTILDENFWDYSVTTSKYRNKFLEETTAETRQKIKAGIYELADLNN